MYRHIILFRFDSDLSQDDIDRLFQKLGALGKVIPQIGDYYYGRNDASNLYNKDYDYAFVMTFDSKKERYEYQNHPAHQNFIKSVLEPVIEDAIVFDMEENRSKEGSTDNV